MKTIRLLFINIMFFSVMAMAGLGCSEDDSEPVVEAPEPVEEEEEEVDEVVTFDGSYVGGWTSTPPGNQYTDIPISAIISGGSGGNYTGEFFFTANFVSCCGSGANDGTFTISLDGNTITSWEYEDVIPQCNGLFTGEGKFEDTGRITIEFEGRDCEGDHANASLYLIKQK